MPAKNTIKVLIGGKIITLSGYESEEYLQSVASYMNQAKHQAEVFEEDSQLKDKEMYDLKHDLIEAQIEVENLKKEKEELEQQVKKLEQDMENLLK